MGGAGKAADVLTDTAMKTGAVWLGYAVLIVVVILLGKLAWKLILEKINETKKRLESGHKEFALGRNERIELRSEQQEIKLNYMHRDQCQEAHREHMKDHDKWEVRFAKMEERQIESDRKIAGLIGEVRSGFSSVTDLLSKLVSVDNPKP